MSDSTGRLRLLMITTIAIATLCLVRGNIDEIAVETDIETLSEIKIYGVEAYEGASGDATSETSNPTEAPSTDGTTAITTVTDEVEDNQSSSTSAAVTVIETATSTTSKFNDFLIMVVNSTLKENEIENELNRQFTALFNKYCTSPSADQSCEHYVVTTARAECSHDVEIFYSIQQGEYQVLYTTVYHVCDTTKSPMPSALLTSFYNATSQEFTGLTIVEFYPASQQPSTTAPHVITSIVYVYDESYIAATIVLSVLLGLVVLAVLAGAVLYYLRYIQFRKTSGRIELSMGSKATYGNFYESQPRPQSGMDTRTGQRNPNFEEVVI